MSSPCSLVLQHILQEVAHLREQQERVGKAIAWKQMEVRSRMVKEQFLKKLRETKQQFRLGSTMRAPEYRPYPNISVK